MGIVIPRPAIRKGENRRIRNRLARHHELMTEFEAQGMTREAASAEAYKIVKTENFK